MANRLSVGRVLITPQTRKWTKQQLDDADTIEKTMCFKNFNSWDNGKSREFFKKFNTARECAEFVREYNKDIPNG